MIRGNASGEPSRPRRGILYKIKMALGWKPSSPLNTGKGKNKTGSRITHGFSLAKGKANHPMEDYHVAEFRLVNNVELGLFGIFDGHLGHDVPEYLQSHLFENIINQPEFWKNPKRAIDKAYEMTDAAVLQKSSDLGFGGSTAVTAILVNGQRLFVANVGDSRAVLCRNGNAIQLSFDHEPKVQKEKMNIEDKGGFVTTFPGDVARVDGQLAVSRTFGDKNLKLHVSADPHVVEQKINRNDEFLILASDGLWKVMENQDAVNIIMKVKDPKSAAKKLTEAALTRESKDDISCIVVRF